MEDGWYYRSASQGYTEHKYEVGVFKKEYAVSNARKSSELSAVPIVVKVHNDYLDEMIIKVRSMKI